MASNPTLVIVEDDQDLASYLQDLFTEKRFVVHTVSEGTKALKLVEQVLPDLIILDLGLPDISGESLCSQIKELFPGLPVIILTAKDDVSDIVRNLEKGADDYITKPFDAEELIARVRARLRQIKGIQTVMRADDLELNTETVEVKRQGELIPLTYTEHQLLHYLLANKNRVLSREMILSHVWAYTPDIESRVVDVYVGYLRRKVDRGHQRKLIHSVRGFGYVLKDEESSSSEVIAH